MDGKSLNIIFNLLKIPEKLSSYDFIPLIFELMTVHTIYIIIPNVIKSKSS